MDGTHDFSSGCMMADIACLPISIMLGQSHLGRGCFQGSASAIWLCMITAGSMPQILGLCDTKVQLAITLSCCSVTCDAADMIAPQGTGGMVIERGLTYLLTWVHQPT